MVVRRVANIVAGAISQVPVVPVVQIVVPQLEVLGVQNILKYRSATNTALIVQVVFGNRLPIMVPLRRYVPIPDAVVQVFADLRLVSQQVSEFVR